jgi:hypothetical protein
MDQFEHQKSAVEAAIPNQFDIAGDLFYGMLVISSEIACDANEAWRTPVDIICRFGAELLHDQPLKLLAVVEQPIELE